MTTKLDDVRISNLLAIVREAAAHSAKLTHIGSAAMTELFALNDQLRIEAVEETKKQAALKAEADAKDAARRAPIEPRQPGPDESPDARPSVYPGDSNTATIADRRM